MAGESKPQGGGGAPLFMFLVVVALLVTPLLVVEPARFERMIQIEHMTYRAMLGETMVNRILDQANEFYSEHTTAPAPEGASNLGEYLAKRMEVLDLYLYLTCYRLAYLFKWDFLAVLLIVGFAVDGQMRRRAKMWDFSFVSPLARKMSQSLTLVASLFVPLAFLAPVPLTPLAMPLALLLLGIAVRSMSATMQKRT